MWGWREDENRPPYKWPEAIIQAKTKKNLITNSPFTWKENLSLVSFGGAWGDQDEPGSHTTIAHTTPRTWRVEGELFTYASWDKRGQHYRSCAIEWGWREDENWPPYQLPKAIVQASPKKQLNYQPTFHMDRKLVTCIIWMGTRGLRRAQKPHHKSAYNSKNLESKREIVHICLTGRGWPTLHLICYQVGMERRWKSTTLQMTQGHPSGKPRKTTQLATHLSHGKKTYHSYHLDGHKGLGRAWEPHHNIQYISKDLESRRGNVHICLLGQTWPTLPLMCYRVGMERRWKSGTLKLPKAILQENLEKWLNHQPTFHTKRKPVIGIIWMGIRD